MDVDDHCSRAHCTQTSKPCSRILAIDIGNVYSKVLQRHCFQCKAAPVSDLSEADIKIESNIAIAVTAESDSFNRFNRGQKTDMLLTNIQRDELRATAARSHVPLANTRVTTALRINRTVLR